MKRREFLANTFIAAALMRVGNVPAAPMPSFDDSAGGLSSELLPSAAESHKSVAEAAGLFPDYTFDSFIEGRSNRHARGVAFLADANPYNIGHPLCIYGACGVGKTHLMQAIGHKVLMRNPDARVKFVHTIDFHEQLRQSRNDMAVERFRKTYDSLDVLLMDHIQDILGKLGTQAELLRTLDKLAERRSLIVMTGDRLPQDWTDERELAAWNPDFLSRIHNGQPVDLLSPDLELRKNCLTAWTTKGCVDLGADVVRYVARRTRAGNMRDLEGAWNRIVAWSVFYNQEVSLKVARKLLADFG